jgi:chemotaxis protein MotB
MARAATRRARAAIDFWPGFVDAMATLLLVIVFLLAVFVLGQFVLGNLLTGKERTITQLESRIAALATLLSLEESKNKDLQGQLTTFLASLNKAKEENKKLVGTLAQEKEISGKVQNQLTLLNQQLAALRKQLAALEIALEASEAKDKKSQAQIKALGQRLNTALASKVQELARYRSDFMAALREILKGRKDFEIVGDRFILQSEVLFGSGEARISPQGKVQLRKVARVINDIRRSIPSDVRWILRVDGHTDIQPIKTKAFPSNWDLSAARALAVVQFLITQKVPPQHLVAAGFGEYHPLKNATSPQQWKRNRRIEFKLTQR